MRLNYLIPETQYGFFRQVIPVLQSEGITVEVNSPISDSHDVTLGAILPITHELIDSFGSLCASPRKSRGATVAWHWDDYSFVDSTESRWMRFYLDVLTNVDSIWSCTHETARKLWIRKGFRSDVVPAWVDLAELNRTLIPQNLPVRACYAIGGGSLGKRRDWAERACHLEEVPLTMIEGQSLSRDRYLEALATCSVYLMTAFEESNATIPALEAMALGKPVVAADLPETREVLGDWPDYFPVCDFLALRIALFRAARSVRSRELGAAKAGDYDVKVIGKLMARRLRETVAEHLRKTAKWRYQ